MNKQIQRLKEKILEAIDYGDRPERMDPLLVAKLEDPKSLYAQNPAMTKAEKDVQRLVSARFRKVAEELSKVSGRENVTPQVVQELSMEIGNKMQNVLRIQSNPENKKKLENLAIQLAAKHTGFSKFIKKYQIVASLGAPDAEGLKLGKQGKIDFDDEKEEWGPDSDFDVNTPSPKENLELEFHKTNLINAITQGYALKSHDLFEKDSTIKTELDKIDRRLYKDYISIMALTDYLYFVMYGAVLSSSQLGRNLGGKIQVSDSDSDYEGEGNNKVDTKIKAEGYIFPILLHELVKGFKEVSARHGESKDPVVRNKVIQRTDTLANEPEQLMIGYEIVNKLEAALPEEIVLSRDKSLRPFFEACLYRVPAKEFIMYIGYIISDNQTKINKGKEFLKRIVEEAEELKEEYENYKEEEGIDPEEENQDDINDFLSSLGIEPPIDN